MTAGGVRIAVCPAAALALALVALGSAPARAQGCVAARMSTPVCEGDHGGERRWQVALSWRYQKSDRHFRGSREEPTKQQGGAVVTWFNQYELSLTRTFSPRWSVALSVPYLWSDRGAPVRDPFAPDDAFGNDPVVLRPQMHAHGLGDISIVPRLWLVDPARQGRINVALGLGLKLPTGAENAYDARLIRDTTPDPPNTFQVERVTRNVDLSIQPGDGGFGAILDLQAYLRFAAARGTVYVTGAYLANPRNTNGVPTYRDNPGEQVVSVADQYLYRAGVGWSAGRGVGLTLGGRMEGVPTRDLSGGSAGFRRPGYSFSVEPGASLTRGAHTVSLFVPVALHRNRQRSVPEIVNGEHGDAAFADWVLLAAWARRF